MTASPNIQDPDALYTLLRPTVDKWFRIAMRRYRCIGREHIPQDGQIIFAPNHQNGLLDALAILSLDSRPKVFVSRADIHRNPRVAKILKWLKIMPIHRMRDGLDSVRHNDETIHGAVQVLGDGVPFCIMPEGTHRRKHSLLPLQKGIFRIALQAVAAQSEKKTYIVPVGLEYGDWYRMWDSLTVCIGEPIVVNEWLVEHRELTEAQQIVGLQQVLSERMQQLILYVPDNEQYEEAWHKLDANRPAPWQKEVSRIPHWVRILLLIAGAPLYAVCAVLTAPMHALIAGLNHRVRDVAFRNSIEFVVVWLNLLLTLGMVVPLWCYTNEYTYQINRIRIYDTNVHSDSGVSVGTDRDYLLF